MLEALQQANLPPSDQVQALRALVHFLDAIPAICESDITRPLHQLLAALPDFVRLAGCWNQLAAELFASGERDVTMAEAACAQLRAMLKFASSFAGEQITALLLPLSELQAEAALEVQRGCDLVPQGPR